MTYRLDEAVCSGGIPILVSSDWVSAFQEFHAFDAYGVLHKSEEEWLGLKEKLVSMPPDERQRRSDKAREVCKDHFQLLAHNATTVGDVLSGRILPQHPE